MPKALSSLSVLALLLVTDSAGATEPFPVYPELAGLHRVAIVTSFRIDIDRQSLEREIRQRLGTAGFQPGEGLGLPTLRIDVDTSPFVSPLCPGLISLQVRLALKEPVTIERSRKVKEVRARTWTDEDAASIVAKADAASLAVQDVLILVDRFIYNVDYSSKAKWKRKH